MTLRWIQHAACGGIGAFPRFTRGAACGASASRLQPGQKRTTPTSRAQGRLRSRRRGLPFSFCRRPLHQHSNRSRRPYRFSWWAHKARWAAAAARWEPSFPRQTNRTNSAAPRPKSRRARPVEQRRLERDRRSLHRRAGSGSDRLIKLLHWRLDRRGRLLRGFLDAIRAAAARRHPSVRNQLFALVQSHSAMHPVDAVSNSVRQVRRSGQRNTNHPRVVIIKTSIMSRNDGIVFRYPL